MCRERDSNRKVKVIKACVAVTSTESSAGHMASFVDLLNHYTARVYRIHGTVDDETYGRANHAATGDETREANSERWGRTSSKNGRSDNAPSTNRRLEPPNGSMDTIDHDVQHLALERAGSARFLRNPSPLRRRDNHQS